MYRSPPKLDRLITFKIRSDVLWVFERLCRENYGFNSRSECLRFLVYEFIMNEEARSEDLKKAREQVIEEWRSKEVVVL